MAAIVGPAADARPATPPARGGFRADIQGLRALAVILVLGYHAGVPWLSGGFVGVDVFFVISGFLITGLILREVERTGTLDLATFYSRRARRLLPATAVVLAASAVITLAVLPITRWATIGWDVATSALYVTNWWLADQAVDYLAAAGAPSPVQHFWTLAVEEQFYLVWPLLLLVLIALHRRTGWRLRPLLLAGILTLAVGSFAWSVSLTTASPGRAYFVTTTRVWELAIGAVLAFAVKRAGRLPARTTPVIASAGLLTIAYAAITFDAATAFPGSAALLPTLGTAAVITAGMRGEVPGLGRLLTNAPMRTIGGLSYSLYLWHWPLLVGAQEVLAEPGQVLPVHLGLVVVCISALPAWLTFRLVEAPIHHAPALASSHRRNAGVALACTAIGVAAAAAVAIAVPAELRGEVVGEAATNGPVGTEALDDTATQPGAVDAPGLGFAPGPIEALRDVATLDGEPCIQSVDGVELATCSYGPTDAEVVVAVVGDSKMHQWLPAIERIADRRGWRIETHLKSSCPLVRVPTARGGGVNRPCQEYNERLYERLLEGAAADIVLTSQRTSSAYLPDEGPQASRQAMVDDLQRSWRDLGARGSEVLVVLDNPGPPIIVPDCVAANLEDLGACAFARDVGVEESAAPVQLEALAGSSARVVDVREGICPEELCPPVLGDVLVYRQGSHLTATYAARLTDRLEQAIEAALAG